MRTPLAMRSSLQGGRSCGQTLTYTGNWAKGRGGHPFEGGGFFTRLQHNCKQLYHVKKIFKEILDLKRSLIFHLYSLFINDFQCHSESILCDRCVKHRLIQW